MTVLKRYPIIGKKVARKLRKKLEIHLKTKLQKLSEKAVFGELPNGNCDFCGKELQKDWILATTKNEEKFLYHSERCYNRINKIERELSADIVIDFNKTWNKIFYTKDDLPIKGHRIC